MLADKIVIKLMCLTSSTLILMGIKFNKRGIPRQISRFHVLNLFTLRITKTELSQGEGNPVR